MRNLIDKKSYRTFVSTCFDINKIASTANTLILQNCLLPTVNSSSSIASSNVNNNNNTTNITTTNNTTNVNTANSALPTSSTNQTNNLNQIKASDIAGSSSSLSTSSSTNNSTYNLSPSYLSLIVAAGFNKGDIHLFDAFKKDASVFYNDNVS